MKQVGKIVGIVFIVSLCVGTSAVFGMKGQSDDFDAGQIEKTCLTATDDVDNLFGGANATNGFGEEGETDPLAEPNVMETSEKSEDKFNSFQRGYPNEKTAAVDTSKIENQTNDEPEEVVKNGETSAQSAVTLPVVQPDQNCKKTEEFWSSPCNKKAFKAWYAKVSKTRGYWWVTRVGGAALGLYLMNFVWVGATVYCATGDVNVISQWTVCPAVEKLNWIWQASGIGAGLGSFGAWMSDLHKTAIEAISGADNTGQSNLETSTPKLELK